MKNLPEPPADMFTARAFTVAWYWFLLAVFIAVVLRWMPTRDITGWNINYIRHAHSHVAFLGWIFNGFFAIAVQLFVAETRRKAYLLLFIVLQVAVAGMAASFPLQGYAAVSITFSTLHMVAAGVFAWWLWSSHRVTKGARTWLRLGLAFMLLSGLGPIVLGPLAAMDLRDHPAYTLAIYFYLHCQYNGWFIFFLLAAVWQQWEKAGLALAAGTQRSAVICLGGGALGSFALSTLWLHPPWPVWLFAVISTSAQLWGAWQLKPLVFWGWKRLGTTVRMVLSIIVACFVAKLFLQLIACVPILAPLAHHRSIAIAFLHLVFLGIVTPGLAVWAWEAGWIRRVWLSRTGGLLFLTGSICMELTLVVSALAGLSGHGISHTSDLLLGTGAMTLIGLLLIRPAAL